MLSPQEQAKDMIASYWGIILDKNKETLLKWMDDKDNHSVSYGVPLLAKQCALKEVDDILEVLGDSGVYLFADPKVAAYYEKVKQALISM